MQVRAAGFLATAATSLAAFLTPESAMACHKCQKTPCVLVVPAPAPTVQCVTEMVPQTVYRTRTRMESRPVTETVMTRVANTRYVERPRIVCKPVSETSTVQRTVFTCRPVSETTMVDQSYTVCRPVQTTQQVTEYAYQPSTRLVTFPARVPTCGKCGKVNYACGCITVAQTCYIPVPTTRDVVVTTLVAEQQTRQVPVTTTRLVQEQHVENVPVRTCRMVTETVVDRVPVTTFQCVPKQVTRMVPFPVCETVAETCYVPVRRLVAVAPAVAAPAAMPAPQAVAPTGQAAPAASRQG